MTLPDEEVWSLKRARQFLRDLATMNLGEIRSNARDIRSEANNRLRHYPPDYVIDKLWEERIKDNRLSLGLKIDDEIPLDIACNFIAEHTGSCPNDMCDFEYKGDCEYNCSEHITPTCWKAYFIEQAKEGENGKD